MSPQITFQPMRVLIDGHDAEGRLILANDQLTAVIVRLDGKTHGAALRGRWHLEAGFGKCDMGQANAILWGTPEEAGRWVEERLARGT